MPICRREFGACLLGGAAALALPRPRPKLLVLVLVVQLRADYLEDSQAQFGGGGLHRLMEKGAYFPDCSHLASTFSASTIATLATGAWPAEHGIVADSWYDRPSRTVVHASDEALSATTLAAQTADEAASRVFVLSMERSHAAIFAGTPRAKLFWMDEGGRFVTAGEELPWLGSFNQSNSPEGARDAKWTAIGARLEAPPMRVLRYDGSRPRDFVTLYKSSPFGQGQQFNLLAELISREKLGQGATLDFVCLISGGTELLGYETGARSPLMQQMVLQLDRRLEALINELNRTAGENSYNLVLAGAHGAPPEPSIELRQRMAVKGETVVDAVQRALPAGPAGRVEKYVYPFLYLGPVALRDAEALQFAAGQGALQSPAVANYYTASGVCSTRDAWVRRFRNSFHAKRSGDVMLSYRPEYVEEYGANRGVSYGSLYNYDARVPLCFFGPSFATGVFERAVESVDVAPTLARVMGVAAPSSSTGHVLGEALAG